MKTFSEVQIKRILSGGVILMVLLVILSLLVIVFTEPPKIQSNRDIVFSLPKQKLKNLGQHFVVGYSNLKEISRLAESGAIAGIFITKRNVKGKSFNQLRNEINDLQNLRIKNSLAPLLVTSDHEGGLVSRLSPLLTALPPLSSLAQRFSDKSVLRREVQKYAAIHGRELKNVGVNVNLGPVVDIHSGRAPNYEDLYSHINSRSIHMDPNIVTLVTKSYCETLLGYEVIPTLKHFPGLRMVTSDTHLSAGYSNVNTVELEEVDWKPYQITSDLPLVFIMAGHVILNHHDSENITTQSEKVLQGILRKKLGFKGIIITDDLCMGAVVKSPGGIKGGAARALNAGVDLVLISKSPKKYYEAMAGLIEYAEDHNSIYKKLDQSKRRLHVVQSYLNNNANQFAALQSTKHEGKGNEKIIHIQ